MASEGRVSMRRSPASPATANSAIKTLPVVR
jgi:hypothetical protein